MEVKSNSKKQKREELLIKLGEAENELAWLEYKEIPRLIKELKKLGITKREIEENNLEDTINIQSAWKLTKK